MTHSTIRFAFGASTILIGALALAPSRVLAQTEAPEAEAPEAEEAAAVESPAAPATEEAAKPAEPPELAAPSKPAEPPKCDCPPPCPEPPPAPPTPPADAVEWKAQSKGGMLITSGNSQSKSFAFGMNASRKQGNNKLALEGGLSYGTSKNTVVSVDANNVITEVHREEVVSTNNWNAKGRYDRFVTKNNTGYASGQVAGDKIAGKTFMGGGQLGYSRQVWEDKWNLVLVELGYDFSYERYVQQPGKTLDPVIIHSARVRVGETLSLTKETGITASVEALFNLNKETKAINVADGTTGVRALKDTRVNGKVALSTNLWKALSFAFSFAFKYDQNPAPRPIPSVAPAGTSWPAGWNLAYAQKWDTMTEATLIYTFF